MTSQPYRRPVVFVGSSSEGIDIARAIQLNLDRDAEVIPWNQGVFGPTGGTLESLVNSFARFDFAILVLTADDLTLSRDVNSPSPRDNVVFELGLFMGALGRDRCFIVYDRTAKLRLPSDLAGVTAATFQPPESGNLQSALGAPATQILTAIRDLGAIKRSEQDVYIDQQTHFSIIAGLLEPAAHQFLIAMRERGVTLRREERYSTGTRHEWSMHSNQPSPSGFGGFDVNKLCSSLADAEILDPDLRGRISLTERGKAFAEWLVASGYRAEYFWSDIAQWGDRPEFFILNAPHPSTLPRNIFELQEAALQEDYSELGESGEPSSPTS